MTAILKYWKFLPIVVSAFVIFGLYMYEKGRESVYKEIASTPVKQTIVIKHDTIPPVTIIKWLKPDKVYETPSEVQTQIDSLTNDCVKLKALLAEKARPWETRMDSSRFSLYIMTHPWTRINDIDLRLKPVPYSYSEITNSQILIKEQLWYIDALKIGGGVAVGYLGGHYLK